MALYNSVEAKLDADCSLLIIDTYSEKLAMETETRYHEALGIHGFDHGTGSLMLGLVEVTRVGVMLLRLAVETSKLGVPQAACYEVQAQGASSTLTPCNPTATNVTSFIALPF